MNETLLITPLFADGALQFAFDKATLEGKITIGTLVMVSLMSWTVIFNKIGQLWIARRRTRKFFTTYRNTGSPLAVAQSGERFDGSPAYSVYDEGTRVLLRLIDEVPPPARDGASRRITPDTFDEVRLTLERVSSEQALLLEKGMIVLSTAVAGGPFIGLLGTVWGVMETFSGVARANSASLTAMAPGVAGALIATVVGLLVAIPAMFAYNFMVTSIRGITQELDVFTAELVTLLGHRFVTRPHAPGPGTISSAAGWPDDPSSHTPVEHRTMVDPPGSQVH